MAESPPPIGSKQDCPKKQQHDGLKFLPKTTGEQFPEFSNNDENQTTRTNSTEETGEGAMPGNVAQQHNVVHYNTYVK